MITHLKKPWEFLFYNESHFILAAVIGITVVQNLTISKFGVLQSRHVSEFHEIRGEHMTRTLGLNYKRQMLHGFAQRKSLSTIEHMFHYYSIVAFLLLITLNNI